MRPLADASAVSLHAFVTDHVEPGARVITDGWQGYQGLEKLGYVHQRRSQRAARTRGEDPGELLPAVHRIASLIKRWLLGTHQGSVDTAHLTSYLNEFVFRFNRRRSRSRGMVFYRVLELAVAHDPVRYRDLIVDPTPKMKLGTQPAWNARRRTDHGECQPGERLRLNGYPRRGLCTNCSRPRAARSANRQRVSPSANHRAASRVWVRRMKRRAIVISSSRFTGMAGERLEALRRMRRQPTTAAGPPWSVPRGAVCLVALLTMA